MMEIIKGSTDVTSYFKLVDPSTGDEETGLTITDLDMTYVRNRAAAVKADVTELAAVDSDHGDNKMKEVDGANAKGLYRADWPDAAFADGADKVILIIAGAAIDTAMMEINLIDNDIKLAALLRSHKAVQNKTTGIITYYDTDGVTPLYTETETDNEDGTVTVEVAEV